MQVPQKYPSETSMDRIRKAFKRVCEGHLVVSRKKYCYYRACQGHIAFSSFQAKGAVSHANL
jgi:hypothetical protein